MTLEQKFLKSKGIVDYIHHQFIGIEESPIKETDLSGHEIFRAHFRNTNPICNNSSPDVYFPITKLDKPYHALNSGFYLINGEITEIFV